MANLGFVGLGVMGSEMVNRLLGKGVVATRSGLVFDELGPQALHHQRRPCPSTAPIATTSGPSPGKQTLAPGVVCASVAFVVVTWKVPAGPPRWWTRIW